MSILYNKISFMKDVKPPGARLCSSDPRRPKDMIGDVSVTRSNNGGETKRGEIKRGEIKRGEIERGTSLLVFFSLYGLYALQP